MFQGLKGFKRFNIGDVYDFVFVVYGEQIGIKT